mmetsp:Transcript_18131/g.30975  ORF Transcript_18131/g.30975 Transcript_18131/m.30975 type:complete len:153 (+) Transcript_18131:956-1414(+)
MQQSVLMVSTVQKEKVGISALRFFNDGFTSDYYNSSKADSESWESYQVTNVLQQPLENVKDLGDHNYAGFINLHFDRIVKYQVSPAIKLDEFIVILGGYFGLLLLLQKLVVTCYVKPKLDDFLSRRCSDLAALKKQGGLIQLARVGAEAQGK